MRKVTRASELFSAINYKQAEIELCDCGEDAVGTNKHGRPACKFHSAPNEPFVPVEVLPVWEITPEDARLAKKEESKEEKGFKPPAAVQSAARHALKLIEDGKAGDGFTSVGRGRAHQLANGETLSLSTVKRMHSYFSRHRVDKKGKDWDNNSPGKVAWLAWGGDAGASWAASIVKKHGGEKKEAMSSDEPVRNITQQPFNASEGTDRGGHVRRLAPVISEYHQFEPQIGWVNLGSDKCIQCGESQNHGNHQQ